MAAIAGGQVQCYFTARHVLCTARVYRLPVVKHVLIGNDEDELTLAAVMYLAARGIVVSQPQNWETRLEFCARVGISPRHFYRVLNSKWAPETQIERGPTGRFIKFRSNQRFDDFARKHCAGKAQESGQNSQRCGQEPATLLAPAPFG